MIRGDRTLAVRMPNYARKDATIVAHSAADVLSTLRQGRVRYLVTCSPTEIKRDDRPSEMLLAHQVALQDNDDFNLVGEFPILIEFEREAMRTGTIYVWEYLGDLPEGPNALPVLIPTAGMALKKE